MRTLPVLATLIVLTAAVGPAVAVGPAGTAATLSTGSLNGVSCASATFCLAVGLGAQQPAALKWSGSSWSRAVPAPVGDYAELDAVSCWSTTSCTAVGYSYSYEPSYVLRPMVQVYDGARWQVVAAPRVGSDSRLNAVSCPLPNFCAAVGTSSGPAGPAALIELWNGRSWRVVASGAGYLQGVSCTARRACAAVGFAPDAGGYVPVAEQRGAGKPWVRVHTPSRNVGDQLYSVDCTANRDCVATGTLVLRRDAGGWSLQTTPRDAMSGVDNGVSCVSVSACQTVGGFGPFAMGWDGTTWQEETTPALAHGGTLSAVDCVSAEWCLAVGQRVAHDSGGFNYPKSLAERWDGASWTQLVTPNL